MRCTSRLGLLAALACLPGALLAATATDTFTVTATVLDSCLVTANDLNFGNYNGGSGSDLDATTTIDVYCTNGTSYDVALDVGTGGGDYTARTLDLLGTTLTFNLYTDSARTTVWGDGSGATSTVTGSGTGLLTPVSETVYGRVDASQEVGAGVYTSIITATVTY